MPTNKKEKITKKSPLKSQKTPPLALEKAKAKGKESAGNKKPFFDQLKEKFEPAKVDAFQEKWLVVPENRKKYEKITDAPQVAAEEILAITNDLIDYIQGEEGGKSGFLKKIKATVGGFFKNPAKFVQEKVEAGKEAALQVKEAAQEKTKKLAAETKEIAAKKVKKTLPVSKKSVKKPKSV